MNHSAQVTNSNPIKTFLAHTSSRFRSRRSVLAQRIACPLLLLCTGLVLVAPCSATPFQWDLTGSLNTAREGHRATLLFDGRVFVAGGDNGYVYLASAELYDPATANWALTGSMSIDRYSHTLTLLPDGRVLVAGGYSLLFGVLASGELYDPATGSWTLTKSLNTDRFIHTATLLPSGKVLVAGGADGEGVFLTSAEIYDPATRHWTATGSLNVPRISHTATLAGKRQGIGRRRSRRRAPGSCEHRTLRPSNRRVDLHR
jgi:WD40 repeat protein